MACFVSCRKTSNFYNDFGVSVTKTAVFTILWRLSSVTPAVAAAVDDQARDKFCHQLDGKHFEVRPATPVGASPPPAPPGSDSVSMISFPGRVDSVIDVTQAWES